MYGPTWPFLLILIVYGPDVVVVNCWDRLCTLGKTPRTNETLPDFCEWCRVTRHPRVFRRLMGCQRDTPVLGYHMFPICSSTLHLSALGLLLDSYPFF